MKFRTRAAVLRALQDPEVVALMKDHPDCAEFFDARGLNIAAPTGVRKLRWLFGADLSGKS